MDDKKTPTYFKNRLAEIVAALHLLFIQSLSGSLSATQKKEQEELKRERGNLLNEFQTTHPDDFKEMNRKIVERHTVSCVAPILNTVPKTIPAFKKI